MKKTIILLAVFMLGLIVQAQDRQPYPDEVKRLAGLTNNIQVQLDNNKFTTPMRFVTTNATIATTDQTVFVSNPGFTVTLVFPNCTNYPNRVYDIVPISTTVCFLTNATASLWTETKEYTNANHIATSSNWFRVYSLPNIWVYDQIVK